MMYRIEKVNENNKQKVIDSIKSDIIKHVFAYYDIQHVPEQTTVYAAFENNSLKGYILIYTAMEFPSVVLEGEADTAEKLVEYAPENHFIIHAPLNFSSSIKKRFPNAQHYIEDWMLVRKEQAKFFKSDFVRRLHDEEDASRLALLLESRENRPARTVSRYLDWISKMPLYGVFINNELVAYAGSFIQLPQIWMIGGVCTHPDHRNKGYSTLATSAVTEEALKNAEAAALFVRVDNYPAIKVYEKIGYRKIGKKLWVDVGTGMKP
jgi:RimJ/RimL family protein N-acetyltransferase